MSQVSDAVYGQGFWQATNKESEGFAYLRKKFPIISEINMKEVIFFGPRNKQLFEDHEFSKLRGLSPRAEYIDRAAAAGWRS